MTSASQGPIAREITALLTAAFQPTRLVVSNDSAKHRGHSGDDGSGESHFSVELESAAFAGVGRVERQRLVNRALGDLPGQRVHALAIKARAPGNEMSETLQRLALSTGVELDVALQGDRANPAMIFLHGFPESHRTWRHQLAAFAESHFVVAPDQRGFARSSKPEGVENYTPDKPVADLFALADALGIERFTLVGHDWGGAIAWGGALARPDRVERLVIVNAPHPYVFQKAMFDDPGQRAASQYIRAFRQPGFETWLANNLEGFYERSFGKDGMAPAPEEERAHYLDEWGQPGAPLAMLNWYRGAQVIVPAVDEEAERPAFLSQPFPVLKVPTLVIWGMKDTALTPSQLEGLDELVSDLTVVEVPDAGHFITWEKPEAVNNAIRAWLTR